MHPFGFDYYVKRIWLIFREVLSGREKMVPPSSFPPSITTTALLLLRSSQAEKFEKEKNIAEILQEILKQVLQEIFERKGKYWDRKLRHGCLLNIQEDVLPTLETWVQVPNVSYSGRIQNVGIYGISEI